MKRSINSGLLGLFVALTGVIITLSPGMASAMRARSGSGFAYAALGDSVAAGFGLAPASTNPTDLACGRSTLAYPYLVAAALQVQLNHLACSSAAVDQGLYGSQQVGPAPALPPQINQAFANGSPRLMTITIGANDVSWNEFISKCYVSGCGSAQDDQQFQVLLWQLRIKLFVALADIQLQSKGNAPQVLLTGYYSPLSNAQPSCTDTWGLTPAEITWIGNKGIQLNQALKDATMPFRFASYVPVNFTGHELCSADSWVQGLQSAGPFHPTAEGQAAIARRVMSQVR